MEAVRVVPNLIGAVLVLVIGVFVASILGHALRVLLEKTNVDSAIRKAKLTKAFGHTNVPSLLGELLKWFVVVIFLQQAVSLVNLGSLSALLNAFVLWLPQLLIAIIVFLLGLSGAHFVEYKVMEHTKLRGMRVSAKVLKWIVVVVVALVSLRQIGVDVGVLENTFLVVVGALGVGVALALGISLGLGLKKEAENVIKEVKKNI
ncbi:hypothetical protein HYX16_03150 [Candidatus Woesearchaeota archaeon]|nr:hypothetical protein [Candidatus Woesearchaeota archaeon]